MTRRQAALLDFLRERTLAGQPVPSFDEMAVHIGLLSKSTIGDHLDALERQGFIKRERGRNRSITVTGIDEYAKGYHEGFRDGQAQRSAA